MTSPSITVYGADWCSDCRRTARHLSSIEIGFDYIDVERDAAAAAEAQRISGRLSIPVVVYPDGTHHVEPSNGEVDAKLRELSIL